MAKIDFSEFGGQEDSPQGNKIDFSEFGGYSDQPQNQVQNISGLPLVQQYQALKSAFGNQRTPLDTVRDVLSGALSGAAKGGELLNKGVMQIPGAQNFASYLQSKLPTSMRTSDEDVNNMLASVGSPNKSLAGNIEQGVGSYLPFGPAGKVLAGTGILGELAGGGLYGVSNTAPEDKNLFGILPSGPTWGGITDATLNALTHGIGKGLESLRPTNFLRGNLSNEELAKNAAAASDTTTSLGNITASPMLKHQFENMVSKFPLSGANEAMQSAAQATVEKGKNILGDMLGENSPDDINAQLKEKLNEEWNKAQQNKEAAYGKFNQAAEDAKEVPNLSKFRDALQRNKSVLEKISILPGDPVGQEIYQRVANATRGLENGSKVPPTRYMETEPGQITRNPLTGEAQNINLGNPSGIGSQRLPYTPLSATGLIEEEKPSYQDANILKGRLNQLASAYKSSSDVDQRSLGNIYKDLGSSLRDDVRKSVSDTQHPKLINAYNQAEENYASNFSKFLDKDVYKFINGNGDSDMLTSTFIKPSRVNDRANQINKLSPLLGESQPLISYSYFSRALDNDGNLNPGKLATLIKNLGANQFEALVPDPVMRNRLKSYSKLYSMNSTGVNLMMNPDTGQKNMSILPLLMAKMGSTALGGTIGGIPGAIAGAFAPGIMAKPMVHYLTDPGVRKALIAKMLSNKALFTPQTQQAQALAQGIKQGAFSNGT